MSVVNHMTITVSWGECDPARMMRADAWCALFDRATAHLFETVGAPWAQLFGFQDLIGVPLVSLSLSIIRPVRLEDALVVESTIAAWYPRRFEVNHVVRNLDGDVRVTATEMRCWAIQTDAEGGFVQGDIPDDIRLMFED